MTGLRLSLPEHKMDLSLNSLVGVFGMKENVLVFTTIKETFCGNRIPLAGNIYGCKNILLQIKLMPLHLKSLVS